VRINASLTDDLLKKIDDAASEQNKSRSRFIREAAEKYIAEHERKKEEEERKKAFAQAIRLQDKLRKKGGKWDGAGEVRKWREKAR
jgi:metal-responsive CopG/Arc/MetJ family transcriptional regulator